MYANIIAIDIDDVCYNRNKDFSQNTNSDDILSNFTQTSLMIIMTVLYNDQHQ